MAALALSLAACSSSSKSGSSGSASADITMQNTAFSVAGPVKAGATVNIKNNDGFTHTVTSDDGTSFNVSVDGGKTCNGHGAEQGRVVQVPLQHPLEHARHADRRVAESPGTTILGVTGAFETIRYAADGPVATITLARPEAANAQSSQLIAELDAAFDQADADDDVRVVVLAAEGKHFSAGHDLKELLAGEEHWAAMRDTPEGKLAPRADDVLRQARAHPRLPQGHDRGGAGHVLGRGTDAGLHVRPDRRRRRRPVLESGAAHVGRRRRAARRAVGARAAQGEGVPVLRARRSPRPRPSASGS